MACRGPDLNAIANAIYAANAAALPFKSATGYCPAANEFRMWREEPRHSLHRRPRIHNKQGSIEAARNFLRRAWIDEEHCAHGIRCLDNYCKEWAEKHGTYKSQPVHNWASHGSDALQTGACGFVPEYIPPPNDRYYRKPRPASAWTA